MYKSNKKTLVAILGDEGLLALYYRTNFEFLPQAGYAVCDQPF